MIPSVVEALTQFFYPTSCRSCGQMTKGKETGICAACFEQVQWLESALACQICGHPKRLRSGVRCSACRKKPIYLQPFTACFAPLGPAWALAAEMEDSAKLLASLMVLKWQKLPWPKPDVIVPMPHSRLETWTRRRQPSTLLAKELSQLIRCPLEIAISTHEKGNSFDYIGKGDLSDKKVLFVIDRVRESKEIKACRFALESLYPQTIYTLALFDIRI